MGSDSKIASLIPLRESSPDRSHRNPGRFPHASHRKGPDDSCRCLSQEMSSKESRRNTRIPYTGPIRISWEIENDEPRYTEGKCLDISATGIRIEVRMPIPVRTRYRCTDPASIFPVPDPSNTWRGTARSSSLEWNSAKRCANKRLPSSANRGCSANLLPSFRDLVVRGCSPRADPIQIAIQSGLPDQILFLRSYR